MVKLDLTQEHLKANVSALGHYSDFAHHRAQLTAHAIALAPLGGHGSLCVLGAGNCFDLDLRSLASHFAQIHLVDIDPQALARAIEQLEASVKEKVTTHAPVDLSGLYDRIERWARFEVTPEELMSHAGNTATSVHQKLNQTFDVVVSACMLSQMQLSVLHALGEGHQLFQAVRFTLNLAHFRTLAKLTKPGGHSLFVTDVTAEPLFSLQDNARTGLDLLDEATRARKVFDFADPGRLKELLSDDPVLRRAFPTWSVADAWLWTNGPTTTFLVYCCDLVRFNAHAD